MHLLQRAAHCQKRKSRNDQSIGGQDKEDFRLRNRSREYWIKEHLPFRSANLSIFLNLCIKVQQL